MKIKSFKACLQNFAPKAVWLKLGLALLVGFAAGAGQAQTSFATAQVLDNATLWGNVANNNNGVTPDVGAPNNAGYAPNAPLWYQWTAPQDGVVTMDTVGSVNSFTNVTLVGFDPNTFQLIYLTNITVVNIDTVLAVYTGTSLKTLNQVAANDDLFPINNNLSSSQILIGQSQTAQLTESGNADYLQIFSQFGLIGVTGLPDFSFIQPYYGPSGLRFNARGGQTYYFAVDSKLPASSSLSRGTGQLILNWAYKPAGVFRFASEDEDPYTGRLLYQTAETESYPINGLNNAGNSTVLTYYDYNAPGALVTVTRVAGSIGRATVNYRTVDGTALSFVAPNDKPAFGEVTTNVVTNTFVFGGFTNTFVSTNLVSPDFTAVSGTLVFDDFEMSKTILIPIIYKGLAAGDQANRVFGIQLIDDGGATSPMLDPLESGDVSPPRVDPTFSTAIVRILNVNADPYGPDQLSVVSTNGYSDPPANTMPILETNMVNTLYPTNVTFNFEKASYRVPADVNDTNVSPWTQVTLWVERYGTNGAATTVNYRVNNVLGDDADASEEQNILFPLQPGSDFAVPTPPTQGTVRGTNSDFVLAQGTLSFPGNGPGSVYQPITFTVPTSTLTKFNKDFKVQIYREVNIGGQNVPRLVGMVNEATVTILFNDENPPAGSVDEFYNADFNSKLALYASQIPLTTPPNDPNPGVGLYGEVYSTALLTNDEAFIGGDFQSYNGVAQSCVALVKTNGQLDTTFNPGSGANGAVNAATFFGGQFFIGGGFTSYNGTQVGHVARLNADGSLDTTFNPGLGADGTVRAITVQLDGKVLIGGDFTQINGVTRNYIARLNTDGSVDTTFDPSNTLSGPVYSLALAPSVVFNLNRTANGGPQEDDQVVNLGTLATGTLTVNYDMFSIPDDMRVFYGDTNVAAGTGVLIYDTSNTNGASTFVLPFGPVNGVNGLLTTNELTIVMNQGGSTNSGTAWTYNASISVPQVSKGILVGGGFQVTGQTYANLARLNPDGTLDTSFNPGTGPNGIVHALGWQLNDQIVAGGEFTAVNGNSYNHLVRLNAGGSIDTANFFVGTGPDDVVYTVTLDQLGGTIYVGGGFESFNGTHRRGFTRLYANGTVDTTFMDTAYNQFAGLKRIYSYDSPAVFASAIQGDGGVLIGGSFNQVGGGQANTNVCNTLDDEEFIPESLGDTNLWVEPKTRDGVRNRSGFARLVGGATPGPGNLGLNQTSYSANKSQTSLAVSLVRTNGDLGPVSANFSVLPSLAQSGIDYAYNSAPPIYWVGSQYIVHPTRERSDGLFGQNGFLIDPYGLSLTASDAIINQLSEITVSIINNKLTSGNLNAQFQMANPSVADTFYLGGENIPLGTALGVSSAPFTMVDDTSYPGTFGFSSPTFIATNLNPFITVLRSNGIYGVVSMKYSTTNGTAVAGTDYTGIINQPLVFNQNQVTNGFNVTVKNNGYITNVEKTVNLRLSNLGTTPGATFGISNAVLRIINPNFQGYVTLGATNYVGAISSGVLNFVVNRVSGSLGSVTVQYATTNGSAVSGTDYLGATNTLVWNSGDVSPRVISIPLFDPGILGPTKQFGVRLSSPTLNGVPNLALMGLITNATLTISNDNNNGTIQFGAPSYIVNEDGGYANVTIVRSGGAVGAISAHYATSDGTAANGFNYTAVNGTVTLASGQLGTNLTIPILDDGVADPPPANFYFYVSLDGPGTLTNTVVRIVDAQTYNRPPGSPDTVFNTNGMNGDVFALALQSNGQIMAGGNFTAVGPVARNSIARLNTDGSLDTAFLNELSGANAAVNAVVSQTDDRIMVGGAFTSIDGINRNFIARLMTDGTLDTSFNPGSGADNTVNALAETFIGGARRIYIGGAFGSVNGVSSPGVARLKADNSDGNNDGTVDAAFNVGSGADGQIYAIAVYPTNSIFAGKVLIGGLFDHFNGVTITNLARLNADGSLDTNFNAGFGSGPDGSVHALAIQNTGQVLVGGGFTNFNGTALNRIARLNTDGTLDTNFVAAIGTGADHLVEGILLQPDDRIVLVGQFTQVNGVTRNHITRLLPMGATDPTINFGLGANGDVIAAVYQPADGMMVIGGAFSQYDGQPHASIARIYGGSVTGSGAFTFAAVNFQADENSIVAPITILRTGGTSGTNADGSGDILVHFATISGGSAVDGVNYLAVSTDVDFPAGEVEKTVLVPVLDDLVITSNLTVNLALSNPTPPATNGVQTTATLTIVNDDNAVAFSSAFYTQAKNTPTGVAVIDVLREGGINTTSTVDFYTITNGTAVIGTDYYPTNATLTFIPGQSDIQIQVPIINNSLAEGNKTVGLELTNAVNTLLAAPSNSTLTIIDTVSVPGQLYFSATNFEANSGDGYGYLTVLRTNGSSGSVSVAYNLVPGTAKPGLNYVAASGTLTFSSGDTTKFVPVQLVNNSIVQGPVSLSVDLSNPTGGATLTAPTNALLTILNTNVGFAFLNATNYVRETNGLVPIYVQRLGGTNGGVQVSYSTANGTGSNAALAGVNYNPVSGTLTFATGEMLKAVSLPLIYDPQVTGNLILTMKLSNPSIGTVLAYPSNAVVVVQDADAGFSFTNSAMSVFKNVGNAVITVICSNPSIEPPVSNTNVAPLSVGYATADGTALAGVDYQATSGVLFFTNGVGTNTIDVPIFNNSQVLGDHSFSVNLLNPTAPGQLVPPSTLLVTIVDNNSGLSFSSPVYTVLKTGVSAAITVLRNDFTNAVSTVNFSTADGTAVAGVDYIATNGTFVFTNGETSHTFLVTVIANTTVQPDKTVLLQLSNPTGGFLVPPSAATLTIHDTTGSLVVPAGSTLVHESFAPANGIIDPGENVTLLLALRASGGTNIPNVYATLLATNGITSPSPGGAVSYGSLIVNGPSASRQFSFTANGTNSQQIGATLQLNNGVTNIGTAVFTYTLGNWTTTFYNTNGIIINDHTIASPYPSGILVSNVGGVVIKSVVTLTNLYHGYTKDIEALVVSPAGPDTLIMSHAGNGSVAGITLTFDDAAASFLSATNVLTTGTNKPTAYSSTTIFP